MNSENKHSRRIMIVLEDDGDSMFNMKLEGDIDRLGKLKDHFEYSPAEFWAQELFAACQTHIRSRGTVKTLNREERRAQE